MKYVTSYISPDLDGTACTFAYAEFLSMIGESAKAIIFGTPHKEALFVMNHFGISPMDSGENITDTNPEWILTDCSEFEGLSATITPDAVIEIIDHRTVNDAKQFPNARVQIELVGSAATLIAERFFQDNRPISTHSAALLYSAIISNTINFKATVTTDRDRTMARWLQSRVSIPHNYIHDMFLSKSQFDKPLLDMCRDDFATWNKVKLGIVQLEVVNAENLIDTRKRELLDALHVLQREHELKFVFLTAIDLDLGNNTFLSDSENTQKLLEKALDIKFNHSIAKRNELLMRKQIVPKILDALS